MQHLRAINCEYLAWFCFFRQWKTLKFSEAELAVRLLYMMGEAVPVSAGNHFTADGGKGEIMKDMMRTVSTFNNSQCYECQTGFKRS